MPVRAFVIEHLEPVVSKWVWVEYKHASEIVGRSRLIITNVEDPREREVLSRIAGEVLEESIADLPLPRSSIVVLDPQGARELVPEDFESETYVVVGGIMGDCPPRGRTKELLTSRLPGARIRTLGDRQFSVDGAVYVAKRISEGARLEEIEVADELEIVVTESFSIILPFAYPLVEGRPLVSEELVDYLVYEIEEEEAYAIRRGRPRSVAELSDL